jgi:hypothetical protein
MRFFTCGQCGSRLYFENTVCESCGTAAGFWPDTLTLVSIGPEGPVFASAAVPGQFLRYCRNYEACACNWLVPSDGPAFCTACALNRTIPDITDPEKRLLWTKMQQAKARLVYALLRLGLSFDGTKGNALAFDILAEDGEMHGGGGPVLTGHENGLITLNLAEAHDAEREERRLSMGELYRTLLGHFRHESGHYFWDQLVGGTPAIDEFRRLFGDERQDYAAALKAHYDAGPSTRWRQSHISSYASAHPWEDWAETWAHYLHIVDTQDSAAARRLSVVNGTEAPFLPDPYTAPDAKGLIAAWLPLAEALNALNRSMGLSDLYPFVLTDPVVQKLAFVHDLVAANRQTAPLQQQA